MLACAVGGSVARPAIERALRGSHFGMRVQALRTMNERFLDHLTPEHVLFLLRDAVDSCAPPWDDYDAVYEYPDLLEEAVVRLRPDGGTAPLLSIVEGNCAYDHGDRVGIDAAWALRVAAAAYPVYATPYVDRGLRAPCTAERAAAVAAAAELEDDDARLRLLRGARDGAPERCREGQSPWVERFGEACPVDDSERADRGRGYETAEREAARARRADAGFAPRRERRWRRRCSRISPTPRRSSCFSPSSATTRSRPDPSVRPCPRAGSPGSPRSPHASVTAASRGSAVSRSRSPKDAGAGEGRSPRSPSARRPETRPLRVRPRGGASKRGPTTGRPGSEALLLLANLGAPAHAPRASLRSRARRGGLAASPRCRGRGGRAMRRGPHAGLGRRSRRARRAGHPRRRSLRARRRGGPRPRSARGRGDRPRGHRAFRLERAGRRRRGGRAGQRGVASSAHGLVDRSVVARGRESTGDGPLALALLQCRLEPPRRRGHAGARDGIAAGLAWSRRALQRCSSTSSTWLPPTRGCHQDARREPRLSSGRRLLWTLAYRKAPIGPLQDVLESVLASVDPDVADALDVMGSLFVDRCDEEWLSEESRLESCTTGFTRR